MTIRVGMIGFGVMAQNLAARIAERPDFDLVTAWDPSAQAMAALAHHPTARPARDAQDVCGASDVDLVYIASPPAFHIDQAHMAFDAGKAVLCEKPLGVDDAAAKALVARVKAEGLRGAVNFGFATAPGIHDLAQRLKRGEIGPLQAVEIKAWFKTWPRGWQHAGRWLGEREQGGFTREVLSHFIFATRRFIGPLELQSATAAYPSDGRSSETHVTARLLAGGIHVSIAAGIGGEEEDDNAWTLIGQKGRLVLHHWYQTEKIVDDRREILSGGDHETIRTAARHAMMDQLAAMMAGRDHTLARFDEAYDVQSVVEEVLRY